MRLPPWALALAQRAAPARPSPPPLLSKAPRQGIRAVSSAVWWLLAPSHWHCVSNAGAPEQRTKAFGDQRCGYKCWMCRRTRWSFSFLAYMLRLDLVNSCVNLPTYLPTQPPAPLGCRDSTITLLCSALLVSYLGHLWPLVYSPPSLTSQAPGWIERGFCHYFCLSQINEENMILP